MSGLFWQGKTLKDLNNYSLCARTRIGLGKCVPCRLVTRKAAVSRFCISLYLPSPALQHRPAACADWRLERVPFAGGPRSMP